MVDEQDPTPEKKPTTPYSKLSEDLPGNSKKQRAAGEKPDKLEKIIQGEVIQRKQPLSKRIAATFTGDDTRTVGNYILFDVVIPAVKQLLSDAVSTGIERLLFGGSAEHRQGSGIRRSYTNYNRVSTPVNQMRSTRPASTQRASDIDDIVLESRSAADDVIESLTELIAAYNVATLADLKELVGLTGNYVDDKWGWTSMVGAKSELVRLDRGQTGYILRLPRVSPLD